jgi:hypothetical protein
MLDIGGKVITDQELILGRLLPVQLASSIFFDPLLFFESKQNFLAQKDS